MASDTSNTYSVSTDVFEGPLDVLLTLIEKRKLNIGDISLAQVTDEFIEFINTHQRFPISQASHFVYVAATLLLIKSKSLLPNLALSEGEQEDIADLEHRLRAYDYLKRVAATLRDQVAQTPLFTRRRPPPEPTFAPDSALTTESLLLAANSALEGMPHQVRHQEATVTETVAMSDMLDRLHRRVTREITLSFQDFSNRSSSRSEVVVSFLALLELIKQGTVVARQHGTYGDISIAASDVDVPRYD